MILQTATFIHEVVRVCTVTKAGLDRVSRDIGRDAADDCELRLACPKLLFNRADPGGKPHVPQLPLQPSMRFASCRHRRAGHCRLCRRPLIARRKTPWWFQRLRSPMHATVRWPPDSGVVAGGCFWGVQGVFQHTAGVVNAVSGYAGGNKSTAQYRDRQHRHHRSRRVGGR